MKGKSHPTNDLTINPSGNPSIHDVIAQAGVTRRRFVQGGVGSAALAAAGGLTLGGLVNTVHAAPVPPSPCCDGASTQPYCLLSELTTTRNRSRRRSIV